MMRSSSRFLLLMGLLLPAMLLASLWLGVYWRLALAMGGLLSGLLCVCGLYTCHLARQSLTARGTVWACHLAFSVTALAFAAADDGVTGGLGKVFSVAPDVVEAALVFTVGVVSLLALAIGMAVLASSAVRLLRGRAQWLTVALTRKSLVSAACVMCGSAMWLTTLNFADQPGVQSNLQAVIRLNDYPGVQVFTPGRFAFEVMATTYALPPDAAFDLPNRLRSFWLAPDAVIRRHANLQDRFSYADAMTERERDDKQAGWENRVGGRMHLGGEDAPPGVDLPLGHIKSVSRGSVAAAAGVVRGDRLVAIDGVPTAQWLTDYRAKKKRLPSTTEPGVPAATSQQSDDGDKKTTGHLIQTRDARQLLLKKQRFKSDGFEAAAFFTLAGPSAPGLARPQQPGGRGDVLYLRLSQFTDSLKQTVPNQIKDLALNRMVALPHVSTLVLDLRGNPGGFAQTTVHMAQILATTFLLTTTGDDVGATVVRSEARSSGQTDVKVNRMGDAQEIHELQVQASGGKRAATAALRKAAAVENALLPQLRKIVFLTDKGSCSASELLIYSLGLYAHAMPARGMATAQIGSTTCGKPYGSIPHYYGGYEVAALSTVFVEAGAAAKGRLMTSAGPVAYPNGLAPTCVVTDAMLGPEAGVEDAVFQTGLYWAATGRCGRP